LLFIDIDNFKTLNDTRGHDVGDQLLIEIGGSEYHYSGSLGIALFQGQKQSVETLLKHADLAMYKAKDGGRNTMRFFDPEMQTKLDGLRSTVPSSLICQTVTAMRSGSGSLPKALKPRRSGCFWHAISVMSIRDICSAGHYPWRNSNVIARTSIRQAARGWLICPWNKMRARRALPLRQA